MPHPSPLRAPLGHPVKVVVSEMAVTWAVRGALDAGHRRDATVVSTARELDVPCRRIVLGGDCSRAGCGRRRRCRSDGVATQTDCHWRCQRQAIKSLSVSNPQNSSCDYPAGCSAPRRALPGFLAVLMATSILGFGEIALAPGLLPTASAIAVRAPALSVAVPLRMGTRSPSPATPGTFRPPPMPSS